MLQQIEGSKAMARAIALCRPQVVCAYPITPQTHIVEGLVVRVAQNWGYSLLSLTRASLVVNCQSALA